MMVVLVVFMEWNETARRQTRTTEPMDRDRIMANLGK